MGERTAYLRKPDDSGGAGLGRPGVAGGRASLARLYESHDRVLALIRSHCESHGLTQTAPALLSAGFSHPAETHFIVEGDGRQMILPYQQTIANQAAAHLLRRPTYCFGPCYRHEAETASHTQAFHQFTFELFTDDLNEVIDFLRVLLTSILADFGQAPDWALMDLAETAAEDRTALLNDLNSVVRPTVVRHKMTGTPPFLNRRRDDGLEEALEVYLPGSGETADGGLRDPAVMVRHYRLRPTAQTGGATIGLARLMKAVLKLDDIADASLL